MTPARRVKINTQEKMADLKEEVRDKRLLSAEKNNNEHNFSWKKILVWIWAVLMLAGIFFGLLYFAFQQGIRVGEERSRALEAIATPKPTFFQASPTPEETLKMAYKIKVLNGSGILGEASKTSTLLENEGYTVESVGNTDEPDYDKTIIQAKENVNKGWIDNLSIILQDTYELGEAEGLEENGDIDVIIIVGRNRVSE